MNKASFCFLSIILLQLANFVLGAIPASERAALIALYNSTDGDSWGNNSGWRLPLCTAMALPCRGLKEIGMGFIFQGTM